MMRHDAVSSVRQPIGWLVVAGGLALYGAAVVVLALARISPTLNLPWWLAQVIPPVVYAVLVRVCVRRVSVPRWIVATLLLWTIHVFLGVLTAGVVASMGAWSVDFNAVEAFPPPLIPEILWVPLLLLPLRDSIGGERRTQRRPGAGEMEAVERPSALGVRPIPSAVQERAAQAPVVAVAVPLEHPRSDVKWPQRAPRDAQARSSGPGPAMPAGAGLEPARGEGAAVVVPARRAVEAVPPRLDATATPETLAAPMRVSFDRVSGQFPASVFQVPLDEVRASLSEPGFLSIPTRLVLTQLGEGVVRAAWDVVAPQFPERLLAVSQQEMANRLPEGELVLPLDELVPQVPQHLLQASGRPVEVDGIERFPAPFQPTEVFEPPTLHEPESRAAEWPETPSTWPLVEAADAGEEVAELPTLEDVDLDPALTGLIDAEPEPVSLESEIAHDAKASDGVPVEPSAPEPILEAPAPHESALEPVVSPARAPIRTETVEDRFTAAVGALDAVVVSVSGVEILASSSSGLAVGTAVAAAKRLLPILSSARGAWTIHQVTLRGRDSALVLTPVGLANGTGSILLSAVPMGGSLALTEVTALRAAAGAINQPARVSGADDADEPRDPDLLEEEPPVLAHQTAAALDAMESVVATTLRIASTERCLHLFLPRGSSVRAVASLAREIDDAMQAVARLGAVFHTAVLRCGTRRLIVRMTGQDTDRSTIIIVGGETGRPGLACRQAEDAALALGAR